MQKTKVTNRLTINFITDLVSHIVSTRNNTVESIESMANSVQLY